MGIIITTGASVEEIAEAISAVMVLTILVIVPHIVEQMHPSQAMTEAITSHDLTRAITDVRVLMRIIPAVETPDMAVATRVINSMISLTQCDRNHREGHTLLSALAVIGIKMSEVLRTDGTREAEVGRPLSLWAGLSDELVEPKSEKGLHSPRESSQQVIEVRHNA